MTNDTDVWIIGSMKKKKKSAIFNLQFSCDSVHRAIKRFPQRVAAR